MRNRECARPWVVVAAAVLGTVGGASAGDPPAPPAKGAPAPAASPEEVAKLTPDLRARVTAWILARRGLVPATCWNCDGTGKIKAIVSTPAGPRTSSSPCSTCDGTGRAISRIAIEKVYGGLRDPRWRGGVPNGPIPTGDPAQLALTSGKVDRIEFVDVTHATVWIVEGEAGAPRKWNWIRVPASKAQILRWVVWESEELDGPWPSVEPAAPTGKPVLAGLEDPSAKSMSRSAPGYRELQSWKEAYMEALQTDNDRAAVVLRRKSARGTADELELLDREVLLAEKRLARAVASCRDREEEFKSASGG